ncbi:hypothetical protein IW145_002852 [Coemansia sp. RSA 521]|nr:hypothetical protein IW142_002456 [Coemansia sp. RSA 564]KAJ2151660.1 hypothetical protein J3F82_003193 [Coemansia sp. RSA 637]KAJ2187259.1 hypothetical protein EV181_002861 [Coemansia sp. RSA 532]KAJ2195900.1 hypothetical protein IW144_003216 [Coemansia sp. RSA 522]KAJ2205349.1 hypothetical protein IW145_002852 [Coemansia sp. RSA 521]KAJ2257672.1 hypothetical protein GGH98_000682 [Coemansia sp. RSA 454]KAJ2288044.1 hypothetical protein IW141_004569 [Coemansia sp. RSA 355]KAJ2436628.1 hyp
MGDSGNRRDDYQLPSIRSLTGSASQAPRPNTDSAAQQHYPQQAQHNQYPAQPPAHEGHYHYSQSQSQSHSHSHAPRLGSPRHSHAPAQSKPQSLPYGYHYQQAPPRPPASSYSGYSHGSAHHHPRPYPRGYGSQHAGTHQPHAADPAYADHSVQSAHPHSVGYNAPPSHDTRYEGSQSLPAGSDYYRQQPQYRAPYAADHSLASPRDRPADTSEMRSHSLHHQQSASASQYRQQPGSSSQYHAQYSHMQHSHLHHSHMQHSPPGQSHSQQHYANAQDQRMAAAHSPDYWHGVSPSSYSGYSAASTPRSAGIRDDAHGIERPLQALTATAHPLPQSPSVSTHRQRPPSSRSEDTRMRDSDVARAPRPRTTEPYAPVQSASRTKQHTVASSLSDGGDIIDNNDDDDNADINNEDDDKSDNAQDKDADDALMKRRKRNAQSAARLRERRKNRESELSSSCSKLEMQISRLENELQDEKHRAFVERNGGHERPELSSRGDNTEAGEGAGKSTESAAVGAKRQRLIEGGDDVDMDERDTELWAGGSKRIRPLRELDQVRLTDLKNKVGTLGKLNQQVCVNLGHLRQEIQRISEAFFSRNDRLRD